MAETPDDAAILAIRATHPTLGALRYERVRQDRRWYYRLLVNERGDGSLTDRAHAEETIAHWRAQGWITAGEGTHGE